MISRFSPAWARNDTSTFARVLGVSTAQPVNKDDPVHAERIERYERNILYFTQAQYYSHNARALQREDFMDMRVNYTGIAQRSVETKADWLFAEAVGINAIALDDSGLDLDEAALELVSEEDPDVEAPTEGPGSITKVVVDRINQIRRHNQSDFWDWIMAVMGISCGDFFVRVDAVADDAHPTIEILDAPFVFPDYPKDITKPMRACQIQYEVDRNGEPTDEDDDLTTVTITEDYRLEIVGVGSGDEYEDIVEGVLTEAALEELTREAEKTGQPPERLTCVYRRFEDDLLLEDTKRDIGIPAIPIIHGLNGLNSTNRRYGADEIDRLIPKVEKFNELYFYGERVARQNAHARLFITGARGGEAPIKSDYDDVIWGGPETKAQVIQLPSDTKLLEFITNRLEKELHADAYVPNIGEGESDTGFGNISGLALLIRFGPLRSITKRHQLLYGYALNGIYTLCLLFDEMIIQGRSYGSVYKYDRWRFKYDWTDQMPYALQEIIGYARAATNPQTPLLSNRTAREMIPGVNPDQEETRIQEEMKNASQQSLQAPDGGDAMDQNGFNRIFAGTPTGL